MNFSGITGHNRELKYLLSLKEGGKLPHAFLFTGQRGIGKRLIAERFLSSFFCKESESPCGICNTCKQISAGTFPDFIILEKDDKGKIPVGSRDRLLPGSVRWLIEKLSKAPVSGNYCVIIDGLDGISEAGQNALLKTIEEPYSRAYIILIAESRTGVLPTIISRCTEITFQPLKTDYVMQIVREKINISSDTRFFTEISGGSVDVALKLHEENTFYEIKKFCQSISGYITIGNTGLFRYTDMKNFSDNDFLLTVLINYYSYMLRVSFYDGKKNFPEEVVLNRDDAMKVIRILLALKKGLKNNLNIKNIIKGFMYSMKEMDTSGFPEPDFSWLK
jgi:hypothetical protein